MVDVKDLVVEKLLVLTKKKHILFFDKCRVGAEFLMRFALTRNISSVILQEEGGWYTYEKSASSLTLGVVKAPMVDGLIRGDVFPFVDNSLVVVNSMPGYFFLEDMGFYDSFKDKGFNSFLVNDVSGSVGEDVCVVGDFIIGSFGKDKPLSISSGGGFVAFDDFYEELFAIKEEFFKGSGSLINFDELLVALDVFVLKKKAWFDFSNNLKKVLLEKNFCVLNPLKSINVLVKFNDLFEKESLIKFCSELNLEFVICPMYIRSNEQALSIEVKKKNLLED